jgi:hypothetical protein
MEKAFVNIGPEFIPQGLGIDRLVHREAADVLQGVKHEVVLLSFYKKTAVLCRNCAQNCG